MELEFVISLIKPTQSTRLTRNPGETWLFFYFFNKLKKYIINLWILNLKYYFIVYIHMNCFLTFQYWIVIYITYFHIECFLTFPCGIPIYNLNLHGLFLNFFTWDIKISNIFLNVFKLIRINPWDSGFCSLVVLTLGPGSIITMVLTHQINYFLYASMKHALAYQILCV